MKLALGRYNELRVTNVDDRGVTLEHGHFLPSRLAPSSVVVGQRVRVFAYLDRHGETQVTIQRPAATLGQFAYLECVSMLRAGAYLDWGMPKDLYVPVEEQEARMVEGRKYVVVVCTDPTGEHLFASARLTRHFDYDVDDVCLDDEVDLLVYGHGEAGVQVVVNQRHRGMIHHSQAYRPLRVGDELRGYVSQVREDNRLDIVLARRGVEGIVDARAHILDALRAAGGRLALHDNSSPHEIKQALGMSKKAFKRGVGGLYKARRITIDDQGITLVE